MRKMVKIKQEFPDYCIVEGKGVFLHRNLEDGIFFVPDDSDKVVEHEFCPYCEKGFHDYINRKNGI